MPLPRLANNGDPSTRVLRVGEMCRRTGDNGMRLDDPSLLPVSSSSEIRDPRRGPPPRARVIAPLKRWNDTTRSITWCLWLGLISFFSVHVHTASAYFSLCCPQVAAVDVPLLPYNMGIL